MLRLIVILFFLCLSLLAVFRAPTNALWYAAIVVTEFPFVFLIIEIVLLVWGFGQQRFVTLGNGLIVISIFLFLSPVARAWMIGRGLGRELSRVLGSSAPGNAPPFRATRMLTGLFAKEVSYQTFAYEKRADRLLSLDFYPSQKRGIRPCVVVVHGGSWAGGDSQQLPQLNSHLALKGYHVASINYRLAPAHRSPAQVEDLLSAVRYLKSKASSLLIDTGNLVLLGRSAGGQLVLAAAYGMTEPGIRGVISFYGPADMVWGAQNPANKWVFNSGKVLEDYIGGTYQSLPDQYAAASPLNSVSSNVPPTLLLHGENDVLVAYEHSKRLVAKLEEQNVLHFLLTLPWATHGFDYNLYGPGGQLSTFSIERFLAQVTGKQEGFSQQNQEK